MSINTATYLRSIMIPDDLPEDQLPQFAFFGRSNVGKSSFINTITNQHKLARSGSTPGVTKKVNLFLINRKFYFADLPGYGYAKMSIKDRKVLEDLIFWYLAERHNKFQAICLLVDARIGPTSNDLDVIEFLYEQKLNTVVIASKIDKLKQSERAKHLKAIHGQIPAHISVIPFSSTTGEGKKEVLKFLGF